MPRKGKEKKKKGLSKKEKRALLEAKLEEKRQEEAQLAELRVRVGNLLAYQQPPSAEEYVTQHMKSLRTNPWALVQDVNFAREFLERLKTVLEASCAGPPAGSVSVMALADVAEEKEDELTEDKSDSPANDDEKTKDKADSADKGDDKASAPVPVDLGSAGAAKQQLSPDIQQGLHDISTFVSGQPVRTPRQYHDCCAVDLNRRVGCVLAGVFHHRPEEPAAARRHPQHGTVRGKRFQ